MRRNSSDTTLRPPTVSDCLDGECRRKRITCISLPHGGSQCLPHGVDRQTPEDAQSSELEGRSPGLPGFELSAADFASSVDDRSVRALEPLPFRINDSSSGNAVPASAGNWRAESEGSSREGGSTFWDLLEGSLLPFTNVAATMFGGTAAFDDDGQPLGTEQSRVRLVDGGRECGKRGSVTSEGTEPSIVGRTEGVEVATARKVGCVC